MYFQNLPVLSFKHCAPELGRSSRMAAKKAAAKEVQVWPRVAANLDPGDLVSARVDKDLLSLLHLPTGGSREGHVEGRNLIKIGKLWGNFGNIWQTYCQTLVFSGFESTSRTSSVWSRQKSQTKIWSGTNASSASKPNCMLLWLKRSARF